MTAAVLDACVLYSAPLRDLLMHLTVQFVFQPKWTERIHSEWMTNLLARRPDLARADLERTRDLMNRWGRDWQVPACEALAATLTLPDPDDRHVLAAAIAAGAPVIVTYNLGDFPADALGPHDVRVLHPDAFAGALLEEAPTAFLTAVRLHRAALTRPACSPHEYLAVLARSGLTQTVQRLLPHLDVI